MDALMGSNGPGVVMNKIYLMVFALFFVLSAHPAGAAERATAKRWRVTISLLLR